MLIGKVKRKVNLLGATAVGKTSLIMRYVKNQFGDEYLKTVGMNAYTKKVPLLGFQVKLLINDVMGEKDFGMVQKGAFMGSYGAIGVVDATRKETLDDLVDDWIPRYRSVSKENAPIILAVNKYDLDNKSIVDETDLEGYLDHFDYHFFTSAKTGEHVNKAFKELSSRTIYQTTSMAEEQEDMFDFGEIDTVRELMDGVFLCTSTLGDMPYSKREELLVEAGIDKFELEDHINEDEAIDFVNKVMGWYLDHDDEDSAEKIELLMEQYSK